MIAAAAFLFALNIHASLIEYDITGKETDTGNGTSDTYSYKGLMIYDTISSNLTFIDWMTGKTYRTYTITNFQFSMVSGPSAQQNVIIRQDISVLGVDHDAGPHGFIADIANAKRESRRGGDRPNRPNRGIRDGGQDRWVKRADGNHRRRGAFGGLPKARRQRLGLGLTPYRRRGRSEAE